LWGRERILVTRRVEKGSRGGGKGTIKERKKEIISHKGGTGGEQGGRGGQRGEKKGSRKEQG